MFKERKEDFGRFQKVIVEDADSGNKLSLVPGHGACLLDLELGGVAILDTYTTPKELDFNNWSKSRLLFPFPNRLKHGTYHWKDQIYQFPINDGQTGNALHGLGIDKPFRYTRLDLEADKALLECTYKDMGEDPSYPFRFSMTITFELFSDNSCRIKFTLQNLHSGPIPAGIGWHPYFKLDEKGLTNLQLQLPPCQMVGIDPYMIPTGKQYDYDRFEEKRSIKSEVLDNCFVLTKPKTKACILISNEEKELRYWQETGIGKFNYFQLFTPAHRESIAIEPMTCNIDAFNNGDGLMTLHRGERMSASCGMEVIMKNEE